MQLLLLLVITFTVIPTAAHAHSQHVHCALVLHQLAAAEAVSGTDAVLKDGAGDVSMIVAVSLAFWLDPPGSASFHFSLLLSGCCALQFIRRPCVRECPQ